MHVTFYSNIWWVIFTWRGGVLWVSNWEDNINTELEIIRCVLDWSGSWWIVVTVCCEFGNEYLECTKFRDQKIRYKFFTIEYLSYRVLFSDCKLTVLTVHHRALFRCNLSTELSRLLLQRTLRHKYVRVIVTLNINGCSYIHDPTSGQPTSRYLTTGRFQCFRA